MGVLGSKEYIERKYNESYNALNDLSVQQMASAIRKSASQSA